MLTKKKKYKKVPKKITSSSFGEMYVDVIKNRNTSKAQIAFNKMKLADAMEADADDGMQNFGMATQVKPYEVAKGIKIIGSYKDLLKDLQVVCMRMKLQDLY